MSALIQLHCLHSDIVWTVWEISDYWRIELAVCKSPDAHVQVSSGRAVC